MIFFLTFKGDLSTVKTIYDNNSMLGRNLFAIIVELSTFIAPFFYTRGQNNLGRGCGILNTFRYIWNYYDFHIFKSLNWDKESMIVEAFKL